jgi:CMP-N,N'-diacetyllegionaminic acid synthase
MKILALIPARGGSKRLPGKNIRPLGGKPLIAWSIDAASDIPEICDILVSTDDPDIARACKDAGASVPWLRPAELATDTASSVDVALHALTWYESQSGPIDGLLLLQPTSPFRTRETIQRGIDLFTRHDHQAVLGVSPVSDHPLWTMRIEDGFLKPYIEDHNFQIRSQDLPPAYSINGCFYLISPAELRSTRTFIGNQTVPLIIESPEEALDIDTGWDWRIAQSVLLERMTEHQFD